MELTTMLSSFRGYYNIENFKKSKATSIPEFIKECKKRAIKDNNITDTPKYQNLKNLLKKLRKIINK